MAAASESEKGQISSSRTTSILTSSTTMESQDQRSTHLSRGISTNEVSSSTNNLAGAPTTSSLGPSSSTSLLQNSQMPWKPVSELEYFDTSTTNNASSISLPSGEDTHEPLYTSDNHGKFQMTDKHKLIRENVEKGHQWYYDLKKSSTGLQKRNAANAPAALDSTCMKLPSRTTPLTRSSSHMPRKDGHYYGNPIVLLRRFPRNWRICPSGPWRKERVSRGSDLFSSGNNHVLSVDVRLH